MMLDQRSTLISDRSERQARPFLRRAEGDQDCSDKLATDCRLHKNLVKKCFTVGTWNIRTLFAKGKLEQLQIEMDNYDYNILGLAKMRWTGVGETKLDNGDKIWWSGEPKRHERGVGFLVNTTRSVLECNPISSKIIQIKTAAQPHNLNIIQIYAPTSSSTEEEIESFYDELEEAIENSNKRDYLIVTGDWNA